MLNTANGPVAIPQPPAASPGSTPAPMAPPAATTTGRSTSPSSSSSAGNLGTGPPPPTGSISSQVLTPQASSGPLQPPPPPPPSHPPYYVDLIINPGESVTLQTFEGNETILRGPITITMISTQPFPPIPMPVTAPPGHMIQQICDENGTLRQVILSAIATPTGGPPPGPPPTIQASSLLGPTPPHPHLTLPAPSTSSSASSSSSSRPHPHGTHTGTTPPCSTATTATTNTNHSGQSPLHHPHQSNGADHHNLSQTCVSGQPPSSLSSSYPGSATFPCCCCCNYCTSGATGGGAPSGVPPGPCLGLIPPPPLAPLGAPAHPPGVHHALSGLSTTSGHVLFASPNVMNNPFVPSPMSAPNIIHSHGTPSHSKRRMNTNHSSQHATNMNGGGGGIRRTFSPNSKRTSPTTTNLGSLSNSHQHQNLHAQHQNNHRLTPNGSTGPSMSGGGGPTLKTTPGRHGKPQQSQQPFPQQQQSPLLKNIHQNNNNSLNMNFNHNQHQTNNLYMNHQFHNSYSASSSPLSNNNMNNNSNHHQTQQQHHNNNNNHIELTNGGGLAGYIMDPQKASHTPNHFPVYHPHSPSSGQQQNSSATTTASGPATVTNIYQHHASGNGSTASSKESTVSNGSSTGSCGGGGGGEGGSYQKYHDGRSMTFAPSGGGSGGNSSGTTNNYQQLLNNMLHIQSNLNASSPAYSPKRLLTTAANNSSPLGNGGSSAAKGSIQPTGQSKTTGSSRTILSKASLNGPDQSYRSSSGASGQPARATLISDSSGAMSKDALDGPLPPTSYPQQFSFVPSSQSSSSFVYGTNQQKSPNKKGQQQQQPQTQDKKPSSTKSSILSGGSISEQRFTCPNVTPTDLSSPAKSSSSSLSSTSSSSRSQNKLSNGPVATMIYKRSSPEKIFSPVKRSSGSAGKFIGTPGTESTQQPTGMTTAPVSGPSQSDAISDPTAFVPTVSSFSRSTPKSSPRGGGGGSSKSAQSSPTKRSSPPQSSHSTPRRAAAALTSSISERSATADLSPQTRRSLQNVANTNTNVVPAIVIDGASPYSTTKTVRPEDSDNDSNHSDDIITIQLDRHGSQEALSPSSSSSSSLSSPPPPPATVIAAPVTSNQSSYEDESLPLSPSLSPSASSAPQMKPDNACDSEANTVSQQRNEVTNSHIDRICGTDSEKASGKSVKSTKTAKPPSGLPDLIDKEAGETEEDVDQNEERRASFAASSSCVTNESPMIRRLSNSSSTATLANVPRQPLPQAELFQLIHTSLKSTSIHLKWSLVRNLASIKSVPTDKGDTDKQQPLPSLTPQLLMATRHGRHVVEMSREGTSKMVYQGYGGACKVSNLTPNVLHSFRVKCSNREDGIMALSQWLHVTPEPVKTPRRSRNTSGSALSTSIGGNSTLHANGHLSNGTTGNGLLNGDGTSRVDSSAAGTAASRLSSSSFTSSSHSLANILGLGLISTCLSRLTSTGRRASDLISPMDSDQKCAVAIVLCLTVFSVVVAAFIHQLIAV